MLEEQLRRFRQRAEAAVADMADGDLKIKAFEVILNHLLEEERVEKRAIEKTPSSDDEVELPPPTTLTGRILALKEENFFRQQRTIGDVKNELANHGWHYTLNNLSGKLQRLAQRREIRRVPGKDGKRSIWKYSD